jgi:hypothetical protein
MPGETHPGSPENPANTKRHQGEPAADFTDLGVPLAPKLLLAGIFHTGQYPAMISRLLVLHQQYHHGHKTFISQTKYALGFMDSFPPS